MTDLIKAIISYVKKKGRRKSTVPVTGCIYFALLAAVSENIAGRRQSRLWELRGLISQGDEVQVFDLAFTKFIMCVIPHSEAKQ